MVAKCFDGPTIIGYALKHTCARGLLYLTSYLQNLFLGDPACLRLQKLLELGQLPVQVSVRRIPSFRVDAGVGCL